MLLIDVTVFALGKAYCNVGDLQQDASGQWCMFL